MDFKRVAYAYVSRVSNKTVFEQAGQPSYASQLLRHQLLWFGKIGRADDGDVLRTLTFQTGSLRPASEMLRRSRGRPRHEWAKCLYNKVFPCFASADAMQNCVGDERSWRHFVANFDFDA